MRILSLQPGKFYYLRNESTEEDFQVKELGVGGFTHYEVHKYDSELENLTYIGNFSEEEFILKFLKE